MGYGRERGYNRSRPISAAMEDKVMRLCAIEKRYLSAEARDDEAEGEEEELISNLKWMFKAER